MNQIAQNIEIIQKTIAKAAKRAGRKAEDVHLVAVSKVQPDDKIEAALSAGHRLFGENRVQEAQSRWHERRAHYPDLKLHLIGPLQTNKAKDAVALFDVIETLDREKLARGLAAEMQKQGRKLPCFIQINTGDEDQKAGINPRNLPEFLELCRDECGLDIRGLMCIPPVDEPPALHFALLKKLAKEHGLPGLSMGMSADFEKAIPLGATYVRVGTGVFGARGL
ncbi:MAG: YggS family pyridoxal phosphate-dependent enzyme [Alphaproteobacteria bacterium]|nr:YggS family pyridoxal phosphate-dependent enzyme [Alphaproteobacteria bacterium]MCD8569941.1 YggS family pyridoxal phosphate-dependent enzyme [Alphaproteobacteria bacterium]